MAGFIVILSIFLIAIHIHNTVCYESSKREPGFVFGNQQCIDSGEDTDGLNNENGWNLLFDLNTDCHETLNLYKDSSYSSYVDKVADIWTSVDNWKPNIGTSEVPDLNGQNVVFKTTQAVVPWETDTTKSIVDQVYSAKSAPHIVLFVVDDWGVNDIGYQSTYLGWTTPNIDKLAARGIKLSNYFSHEYCVPSRAALMTGRYALRFGMHEESATEVELPTAEATMADELRSAGYRTNLVGKWHLGYSSLSKTPTYRGFDYFYGYYSSHIDYWTKRFGYLIDLHEGTETVTAHDEISTSVHAAYVFNDKAVAVIEDHAVNYADQPMFLYFASPLMHTDWDAPDSYIATCQAANSDATTAESTYCAMNLMLDETVGNITCALEANGMSDNTLFVLMSDNGGVTEATGSNYPYRGHKYTTFRGGSSVPAFIYGSESLIPASRRGSTYSGQMHVTDWLPTLMGLATENAWTGSVKNNTIDGADMWNSLINDEATAHPEIVLFMHPDGSFVMLKDMLKMTLINDLTEGMFNFETPDAVFSGDSADVTACLYATDSSVVKPLSFIQFVSAGQSHILVLTVFALTFLALTWYGIMFLNVGEKSRKRLSIASEEEIRSEYYQVDDDGVEEKTPLVGRYV